jgi:hypothetical protein
MRWIIEGAAGALSLGGFEEQSVFQPIRQSGETGLAINVGPDFEIQFVGAEKPVGDAHSHFGVVHRLLIWIGDGEIGAAGAQVGVDDGDADRALGRVLGRSGEKRQGTFSSCDIIRPVVVRGGTAAKCLLPEL